MRIQKARRVEEELISVPTNREWGSLGVRRWIEELSCSSTRIEKLKRCPTGSWETYKKSNEQRRRSIIKWGNQMRSDWQRMCPLDVPLIEEKTVLSSKKSWIELFLAEYKFSFLQTPNQPGWIEVFLWAKPLFRGWIEKIQFSRVELKISLGKSYSTRLNRSFPLENPIQPGYFIFFWKFF